MRVKNNKNNNNKIRAKIKMSRINLANYKMN